MEPRNGEWPKAAVAISPVDARGLSSVADALGIDATVLSSWAEKIETEEMTMLVSYIDGQITGKVNIVWTGAEEPVVREAIGVVPNIVALHVHEDQRRRGVGEALMRAAEEHVKLHGGPQVLALGVEPDNVPALRLYEKLGYMHRDVPGHAFSAEWDETQADGTVKHIEVSVILMTKQL